MALPPPPPGFVPEGSRSPGMFGSGRRKRSGAPALPPPPTGFEVDPLATVKASGATITSGWRSQQDQERLRRNGYTPAPNSLHLDADAIDLTPGKGMDWKGLYALAQQTAQAYGKGAKAIDESRTAKPHIHLQMPGWQGAPGLPPPPAGFVPVDGSEPSPFAAPTNAAEAKALASQVPESTIEAMRVRAIMRPDNFAPESSAPSWVATSPPLTEAQELAGVNRITLPPQPEPQPRIGIAPAINAVTNAISGQAPVADSSVSIGGFFDELPVEVRRKLTTPQIEQYLSVARQRPDAATLKSLFQGFGYDIHNADAIAAALAKGAAVNKGIDYRLPEVEMKDGAKGAALRGVLDPINFLDEGAAVVDTLTGVNGRESIFNSERSFGDILDSNIDRNRAVLAADEQSHPYARLGGQLASGILLPYGAGARTAGQLAKAGAVEGFAAGAGAGEGSPLERLPNAVVGSGIGAVAGPTLGKAFEGAGALYSKGRQLLGRGPSAMGEVANEAAMEAVPVIDDALQAAGPTPAARTQPSGGVVNLDREALRRTASQIEADAPPVPAGHVRLWKASNGHNFTTDLAGVALPVRNGRGGDLGFVDLPQDDLATYALGGTGYRLPTAIAKQAQSLRPANGTPWAAMQMEDQSPELVGRIPDYIDVGNLPPPPPGFVAEAIGDVRPVGALASADDMAALAGRISPDDVLPLGQLAPDETLGLGTREFARAGGRSTYQRGPVDLVGFVRSMGGVADEGGELSHLGINNAARDLDFAKGESFLGALVHDGGHRLDDMAEKAWEAGYFHERPTVPEFLDALADTHSGANRHFLTEDLNEVAEHEANRQQRFAVEQAIDEATPYSDLAAVGDKAGNIDLSRLETRGDIARALSNTETMFGGFDAARRGKISHLETEALADELGMTADQLLRRRQGQALNAEQSLAARRILAKSADELVALAQKAKGGSEADLAVFRKAMLRHAAIQEQVSGATAEAGRALSQFKRAAASKAHGEAVMRAIIEGAGGRESIEDVAQKIIDLQQVPGALNKFAMDAVKPTWKDKAVELYYNSLLSGPQTHAVNIVSNALTAALQVPEHITAAALGQLRRSSVDRVMASELGPRVVGLMQGALEGLRAARYTFKTGKVPDHVSKVEAAMQEAIPGKVGHVLRTPTRALSAEDEFFKAIARRSELAALAVRRARAEGLTGEKLQARIEELNRNPDAAMMAHALDYARYVTFQRPVGPVAGAVLHATRAQPWLKLILPFVRTPTNIIKFAAERSPAAPLLKEWRADMRAGGARRDLAIARMTMGSGLGLVIADLASKGDITGSGPADENARRVMMADGWQPYSIRVGDKYYSYQRLDPLATTLGVAADYVQLQEQMTERQREKVGTLVTASIIGNLSDKTWLSGLSDAVAAIHDPQRFGPSFINRTVGSAIPTGVAQVARTLDPTPREAKGPLDTLQSRIPGLSDDLRPRLDAWGRPIVKEGGLGPDIVSPVYRSTQRHEAINQEALRLGLKVTDPSRIVAGRRLNDEEFHAYKMKAGEFVSYEFRQALASPEWQTLDDGAKRKRFDKIKKAGRQAAREALGLAHGEDGKEQTIPPPPTGFTIAE